MQSIDGGGSSEANTTTNEYTEATKVEDTSEKSDSSSEEEKELMSSQPIEEKVEPCYGRELWDCLPVLEQNSKERTLTMIHLRDLAESIRTGLEVFQLKI